MLMFVCSAADESSYCRNYPVCDGNKARAKTSFEVATLLECRFSARHAGQEGEVTRQGTRTSTWYEDIPARLFI